LQKERMRESNREIESNRERKRKKHDESVRERKKHMDRKGGTREYSKEVLKKNPLIILSVNRASPADGSATSPSRRNI